VTPVSDCSIPNDEVISSDPAGGTEAKVGTPVGLTVSSGEPVATVPTVAGLTQAAATSDLRDAGFQVNPVGQADDSVAKGAVVTTDPMAGTLASTCTPVTLVVSTGPSLFPVPEVIGLPRGDAETALSNNGFPTGVVTPEPSCEVALDVVISSDPAGGTQAPRGSSVNLVVSSGAPQATVPSVAGQTEDAAVSAVQAAGFQATVTHEESEDPEGQVVETRPAAGTSASRCVPVTVVVSTGPALVEVPDLVGKCQATAEDALRGLGLVPNSVPSPDPSEEPIGTVLSTTPAKTSMVAPGSKVTLVLANGSDSSDPGVCGDSGP
jgi:serine/threonine-protein kinase